jgi:hypothetical protein
MKEKEVGIQHIENEIKCLKIEITELKKYLHIMKEKKDPNAWKKLEKIGKKINDSWKSDKQSWELILESRK